MIKRLVSTLVLCVAAVGTASAASYAPMENSQVNLRDQASLQRGAALFMNYCAGCHSLKFQRYQRMADDIGLSEEQVMEHLNFSGRAYGETMEIAMDAGDGEAWFGQAPPDLSLVARAKSAGPDWTYTFLKSFYVDEDRPMGWNNTVLLNASMPNVLWELQGTQAPVYGEDGEIERFELVQAGSMSPTEFDQAVRDISAFLAYVGEPAALKRHAFGVWVVLFLAFFTFIAWLLKKEYWRDVH
jgi:ubiquinol-cytochrome c reductase cytochrome c1 subunit